MNGYKTYNATYIITGPDWGSVNQEKKSINDFFVNQAKPYEAVIIKPISDFSIPSSYNNSFLSRTRSSSIESKQGLDKNNFDVSYNKQKENSDSKDQQLSSESLVLDKKDDFFPEPVLSLNQNKNIQMNLKNENNKSQSNLNKILNSNVPIELENDDETVIIQGESGVLVNKQEIINWSGPLPLFEYPINDDSSPEIIKKSLNQKLEYNQEIAVRYLRPPTPPPPGEIIIQQEKSFVPPPAPPLVIRQQPPRPETPPPLIIREAPPKPFNRIETKIIKVPGKKIPPPPRKVIIERLPQLPAKPQSIIVERWLPYQEQKRRVIFRKSSEPEPYYEKPKNIIIQWEPPSVNINQEFKDLGIMKADPDDYISKYKDFLKESNELPEFVKKIQPPEGIHLSNDLNKFIKVDLEGDIEALSLIDLDKEGLSEYKNLIKIKSSKLDNNKADKINLILNDIIDSVKKISFDTINYNEAKMIISSLNYRLNKELNEEQINELLKSLNLNINNSVSLSNFKSSLLKNF